LTYVKAKNVKTIYYSRATFNDVFWDTIMTALDNFVPQVNRRWLFLEAALLWGAAGLMLCTRAVGWLAPQAWVRALPLGGAGVTSGVLLYRFKFSYFAQKNIKRIQRLDQRESILAFQSRTMYIMIALMMGLGIALRHSAIPKPYLAVVYAGIGLGLLLASLNYYGHVQTG
jgi:hypothetical protein